VQANKALKLTVASWVRKAPSDFVEIAFRYEYRNGLKRSGMQTTHMASIGFGSNNKLFSMNSFRLVHFESYQCGSPFRLKSETRSRSIV
jgi:hypothetical protein